MHINPILAIDFYKSGHYKQYPAGTEYVYSNFTPRSSARAPKSSVFEDKVVFLNGEIQLEHSLVQIRERLMENL